VAGSLSAGGRSTAVCAVSASWLARLLASGRLSPALAVLLAAEGQNSGGSSLLTLDFGLVAALLAEFGLTAATLTEFELEAP